MFFICQIYIHLYPNKGVNNIKLLYSLKDIFKLPVGTIEIVKLIKQKKIDIDYLPLKIFLSQDLFKTIYRSYIFFDFYICIVKIII